MPILGLAESNVSWAAGEDSFLVEEARSFLQGQQLPEGRAVVQIRHKRHVDVTADGVIETVEQLYYYPTLDSIQDSGTDSVTWNTHTEALTITAAAVIDSNGALHRFDSKDAQVQTTDSFSVFTSTNKLILQMPGLDRGAVSVLAYTRRIHDLENFLVTDWAQLAAKSLRREFIVTWDQVEPLWHADPDAFDCEVTPHKVVCLSLLQESAKTDELVYYSDVWPRFSVAAPNSWDDVVHEMRGLVDAAMVNGKSLQPILAELEQQDDPVAALLDLVAKEIRYVSFSEAEHAYLPHSIDDTLHNKFGDCKDKSVLLLALLSELGYEAYPVLVATYMQKPEALALPSRAHFDHMVVCALFANEERCFDPTNVHAGVHATPSWIQGKVRLNISPGSRPSKIPKQEFVWQYSIDSSMRFLADGDQHEEMQRTYAGDYAAWFRGKLGGLDQKDQQEWLTKYHRAVVSGAQEIEFDITGLDASNAPLTISSTTTYPALVNPKSDLVYLDAAYWIQYDLKEERIKNKHFNVETKGVHLTSTYRYNMDQF